MSARKGRILLLAENPEVGGILKLALGAHDVEWRAQPAQAEDAFRRQTFDLAIVDISFGGLPLGLELIRGWRAAGCAFPIIALSDIPRPALTVEAMDAGADDFLRKPYHHAELLARIRKLLERGQGGDAFRKAGGVLLGRSEFRFADATVTPDLIVRFPDGSEEKIRPKQQGILRVFSAHAGRLVLKEELVREVWGSDGNDASHSVNEYISTLRRMFLAHGIDFNQLVVSEPKAGWRIHALAAGPVPGSAA